MAAQTTRALVFWFLGLAALCLTMVEGLPRGLALAAALTILALAEALVFPRQVMWGERPPQTYYHVTANVAFLRGELPPGRVGIDRQLAFADRYEQNSGAVYPPAHNHGVRHRGGGQALTLGRYGGDAPDGRFGG